MQPDRARRACLPAMAGEQQHCQRLPLGTLPAGTRRVAAHVSARHGLGRWPLPLATAAFRGGDSNGAGSGGRRGRGGGRGGSGGRGRDGSGGGGGGSESMQGDVAAALTHTQLSALLRNPSAVTRPEQAVAVLAALRAHRIAEPSAWRAARQAALAAARASPPYACRLLWEGCQEPAMDAAKGSGGGGCAKGLPAWPDGSSGAACQGEGGVNGALDGPTQRGAERNVRGTGERLSVRRMER
eukprot:356582-Chlamydomonas_euryale.AAC.2